MSILSSIPLTARIGDYAENQYGPFQYNQNTPGASFFEFAGKTLYFNLNNPDDYRKAYLSCAPLKSVVNRRAQMFVNGKNAILNKNNDNPLRGAYAADLAKLLNRPNVLQSYKQYKAQQDIYIDVFGFCPVLKVSPVGFPKSIKAMWNLPPWLFQIDFTGNWYNQTDLKNIYKQFYLNWNGKKNALDMDAVFLILDNSIGTDNDGKLLLPDSRLKSLEYDISNEISAKKAANTLITKKGAIGILSNDAGGGQFAPIKLGSEKKSIQDDFRRYGITGQEWQVIITDAPLKWQSMSSPMKDLMLFETMSQSLGNICDGMGMYDYLMSGKGGKGTTFANLNEAKKSQYQDFIIPDSEARMEQLSSNIIPEDEGAYITVDYSHVEVLQESEQAKAVTLAAEGGAYQILFDLGTMTRNDILEAMGQPRITGIPEMDQYTFQTVTPPPPVERFPTQAANV